MKKDTSPYFPQREKLKHELTLRERIPWTPRQKEFLELALAKDTRLMFVKGPAGTAKTILAVYASLKLMSESKISDIIYIRSAVESSDSKIGYLPGDADEKLHFYNLPFAEKLEELLPKQEIAFLEKEQRIRMYPVNYARGMSWNAKTLIFDETQNSSLSELITVVTRLGEYSRCFILADPKQSDLPLAKRGGFEALMNHFSTEEDRARGIHSFEFTKADIVRSGLVRYIIEKLETLKTNGNGNGHSQPGHTPVAAAVTS